MSSSKITKNKDPNSLLNLQYEYLIVNKLKSIITQGNLYNLIIDTKIEPILYRIISKQHLLRLVTSIEFIDAKRKPNKFMSAIYLVDLTIYNMKCIITDVQKNRYKSGHALFLATPTDPKTIHFFKSNQFMGNEQIFNYFNQSDSIKFIQIGLYPEESRVFLTDNKTKNSMPIYFNDNCSELVRHQIKLAARSLLNLMIITGEFPFVRYYSPQHPTHRASTLCEFIAEEFQRQIDEYCRVNDDYPPPYTPDKPRSILLITDRTLDLYAPLLHEFTYQAMAMDIVESLERNGVYKYSAENEAGEKMDIEAKLDDEDDEDWINIRHLHIIESSEIIFNKISELIKNNPLMIDRSKASTSSDLMYIVAHLKGFDEERKKLTLHKTLIDECLDLNADRKLAELAADFEQTCCAQGVNFEGERNRHLHDDLIVLLSRDDLHINDKMRLILIYAFYRGGLIESDFKKLTKFIGVNDLQIIGLISRCFVNLAKLGFPVIKPSIKDKPMTKHTFHRINNEGTYNTSRFQPALKNVLTNLTRFQLDEEWFPYFRDKPLVNDIPDKKSHSSTNSSNSSATLPTSGSLRNPRIKAQWASSASLRHANSLTSTRSSSSIPKQRIFVYVAGGITYSEMRSVYELSHELGRDMYIGSESIINPRDFLIGLQDVDTNKGIRDLELNLSRELEKAESEIPRYLYEDERPPAPPVQSPAVTKMNQFDEQVRKQQQMSSSSGAGTGPGLYRKRSDLSTGNSSMADSNGKSKEKKKTSRLKKLFS
ncbi:sec1 [[Candida] subhashii]|uniref:Sec1 n=1 Tax=[Candida] subhashii TaxID=561895 RepID=A0A8J5QK08_9ASCO|nr:sec1 [[Candida] subhashii]KAG7663384.1 sec1 [[Candida] subhashii]